MQSVKIGIFCFLCLGVGVLAENNSKRFPVQIYYETFCPDSKAFLENQFMPVYRTNLSQHFLPKFIPSGNANYSETTGNFTCEHGEKECWGNKLHACLLSMPSLDEKDTLKFIECTVKNSVEKNDLNVQKCAEETKLTQYLTNLTSCANSTDGSNLFKKDIDDAKQNKITIIPSVTIDRNLEKEGQEGVKDFKTFICKHIGTFENGIKPAECTSGGAPIVAPFVILPIIVAFTMAF